MNLVEALRISLDLMRRDRVIQLLSLLPVAIGVGIYFFLGKFIFTDLRESINSYLLTHVQNGILFDILNFFLIGVFSIILIFLINWTFIMLLGFLSAPLNIVVSARVEKQLLSSRQNELMNKMQQLPWYLQFYHTVKSEIKKVILIVFLTICSFALSLFPLLVPISMFFTGVLLSYSFLDYSFGRHEYDFKQIKSDLMKNFFSWGMLGICFMSMFSIPFLNILVFPFAVVFYSVVWLLQSQHKIEVIGNYASKKSIA
ncbi:MAG: EI24 domain-containing protein [Oligoflexia bacterium]|nr:EI24 domain-containing protein [Oligoflexia bacterium]